MLQASLRKVVHTVKRAGTYTAKVPPTEQYIGRDETGSVYLSTQRGAYTATLLVRVNVVKGGGRARLILPS